MIEKRPAWFRRGDEFKSRISEERDAFQARCKVLGIDFRQAHQSFYRDLIAKAVHESNWQEGLYLNEDETKELEERAYTDFQSIQGPHRDFSAVYSSH